MFGLTVVLGAAWYRRETHTREPLMDLQVLRSRGVLLTNLTSLLGGYAVFGTNIVLPFLLEGSGEAPGASAFGLAAGPLLIGLVLMPRALGQAVFSPLTVPLVDAFGHRAVFTAGMVLSALGTFGLALFRGQLWMVMVELAVLGVGFGFVVSLSGSIIALAAEPGETGIATSITSVLRRAGGAVGAQVSIAVLALLAAPGGGPSNTAYTVSFAVCGLAALAGACCAALIAPRRRVVGRESPVDARDEDF
jgi:MFS family permease